MTVYFFRTPYLRYEILFVFDVMVQAPHMVIQNIVASRITWFTIVLTMEEGVFFSRARVP
jgi:hypothetical protein